MTSNLPVNQIRSAKDMALRALALFGVVGLALGASREDVVPWLKDEGLWEELSPAELAFVSASPPTPRQQVDVSWQSEALAVLLWAIGKIKSLPPASEQCDTSAFKEVLPPFADVSTSEFIASAKRRSEAELLEMADMLLNLHAEARAAKLHSRKCPSADVEVVQERHRAMNWIIGYEGLPWDEVNTDT